MHGVSESKTRCNLLNLAWPGRVGGSLLFIRINTIYAWYDIMDSACLGSYSLRITDIGARIRVNNGIQDSNLSQ